MTKASPTRIASRQNNVRKLACHPLIRATAIEMAGQLFDDMMQDNDRWKQWKELCPELTKTKLEIRFIELAWPRLVEQARATLAEMLNGPTPDHLKDQIADALIKDNALRAGRVNQITKH